MEGILLDMGWSHVDVLFGIVSADYHRGVAIGVFVAGVRSIDHILMKLRDARNGTF